jgi:GNAT superfamily N-acetyltransferase
MRYQIRRLNASDHDGLRELLATRPGIEPQEIQARLQMMEWMSFLNPFAADETTYFIVVDGRKVIAYVGRMPTELVIRGQIHKASYLHDMYVHPQHRERGMGLHLATSLYQHATEYSDSLCCMAWSTDLNLAILRLLHFTEMYANGYVKILNPVLALNKLLKRPTLSNALAFPIRHLIDAVDSIIRATTPKRQIDRVERFDDRFDEFFRRVMPLIGISSVRTSDYLNWKYVDRPYPADPILVARHDDRILGYAVLAQEPRVDVKQGTILDIMAEPGDSATIAALYQASIDHFRDERVDLITVVLSDKRFSSVLKRFLFVKRKWAGQPILLANLAKFHGDASVLTNIDNWHMTKSESDGFIIHRLLSHAESIRLSSGDDTDMSRQQRAKAALARLRSTTSQKGAGQG